MPMPVQTNRSTTTNLASFDSSDTWASSNPFPSITDLPAYYGGGNESKIQQENRLDVGEEGEEEEGENSTFLYQGNNEFSCATTAGSGGDKVCQRQRRRRLVY